MITCIWIFLGRYENGELDFIFGTKVHDTIPFDGWITRNPDLFGDLTNGEIYVNALALITETVSKVGYGIALGQYLADRELLFLYIVILVNCQLLGAIFIKTGQVGIR